MKTNSDTVLTFSKTVPQRSVGRRNVSNRRNDVLGSTLKYLSLVLGCAVVLLPLLVIFLASFKTEQEFYKSPVFSLPSNFLNLQNFSEAFTGGLMLQGFTNTAIILVFSCGGTILIGSMTAYVLSRFNFRINAVVSGLFLLAALIPGVSTQVATFQIVSGLGLFNKIGSNIILNMGTDVISVYIFLQFLNGIPRELDEAALIDGASFFDVYWRVILPLLMPAIATVLIIKGVAIYNDFYTPFLYMPGKGLGTISTSLFRFIGPFNAHWQVICAGVVITIIPTLVIFLFLQKYIYNGLTQGAVK
ncbi:MAG: carbohydrate ABC transporter permease [Anaerolineae bacterium]|nr:carbohydrate ABC transporter permease [Anaerolineae bacterium]